MSESTHLFFSRFSRHQIGFFLLLGLLILRLPYLAVVGTLFDSPPIWLYLSFIIGTYLLTALLIYAERERLQAFWFDLSSAIIFLCQTYLFLGGIGLFAAMRRKQARFPAPPSGVLRWTLAGGLLGVLLELMVLYLKLNPPQERSTEPATLGFLFFAVITQMTNAAVWEEPLFRGFLWGYLRLAKWKNAWIWLFQAGLFTLGHVYYLRVEPFGSWFIRIIIPSLLLGLIAWCARSITASMVTHGCINATNDLLMHPGTPGQAIEVAWIAVSILAVSLGLVFTWEIFRSKKRQVL
jgi:membrane protease YdiL (CAAX protease family)